MWHKLLALFALGMAALASTEAARYIVTCDSSSMDSEGLHSLASNLAANYDTDVLAVYDYSIYKGLLVQQKSSSSGGGGEDVEAQAAWMQGVQNVAGIKGIEEDQEVHVY